MSGHYHAVLWIDHHDALVVHFNADSAQERHLHPVDPPRHLHVKAGSATGTHVTDDPSFYGDVVKALADAKEILVTGPSTAKAEFLKHLHRHAPRMMESVVGIETLARVTDNQLLAEARHFFAKADHLRPQRG